MKLPNSIEITFTPGRVATPGFYIKRHVEAQIKDSHVEMQDDGSFYLNDWPYYFEKADQKLIEQMIDKPIYHEIKLKAYKIV